MLNRKYNENIKVKGGINLELEWSINARTALASFVSTSFKVVLSLALTIYFFTLSITMAVNNEKALLSYIICFIISVYFLFGALKLVLRHYYELYIYEDKLVYKNALGILKTIKFEEVTKITEHDKKIRYCFIKFHHYKLLRIIGNATPIKISLLYITDESQKEIKDRLSKNACVEIEVE